ncbi:galactokinase [Verrucomicrobiota bacterium sgz303538]
MFAKAYAPGRVELLGNHTDYNEGVVLAAAIDRGLTVSGSSRDDGSIILTSRHFGRTVEVEIPQLQPQIEEAWANYSLGVFQEFVAAGLPVNGFHAEIHGDLPIGAGLSSSAAIEVATAYFLLKLYGIEMPKLEIAKLCQRAENYFVGVRSGMLDQATSVFGRAGHAVYLDCRSDEIRMIPFPAEVALVLAESGVKHSLIHGTYNERREQCHAAAQALGVHALRDVASEQLQQKGGMAPLLRRRAMHVVGENERVWRAAQLLESGDVASFGKLMNESHESSRTNFENSTPELDTLVEIARSLPGVLGARLTGGGFGGSIVALVQADRANEIAEHLGRGYSERSGHPPQAFVCRIADGAA